MISDLLTVKYLLLLALAIWGTLGVMMIRRKIPALLLGTLLFLTIAYLSIGSGFAIRIPYVHEKMEVLVYTIHENRVHALARPLDSRAQPMHIVFSIDPGSKAGAGMRESFFAAVRAQEGKRHKTKIVVNMRRYVTEQGVFKYEASPPLPPKQLP